MPTKPPKKALMIGVKVSVSEMQRLKKAAKRSKLPVSTYIRSIALEKS